MADGRYEYIPIEKRNNAGNFEAITYEILLSAHVTAHSLSYHPGDVSVRHTPPTASTSYSDEFWNLDPMRCH